MDGRRPLPELADEWGITLKEAVALCTVSGVKISGPNASLNPQQVAHIEDVLAGRTPMQAPADPAQGGSIAVRAIIGLVIVAVMIGVSVALTNLGNRDVIIAVSPDDCFNDPGSFGTEITPIPCDGPHDYEVDAVLNLEPIFGASFPGWDRIEAHAEERCAALGAGRQTTQFLDTVVEFYYFGPEDEVAWESVSARKVICATKAAA